MKRQSNSSEQDTIRTKVLDSDEVTGVTSNDLKDNQQKDGIKWEKNEVDNTKKKIEDALTQLQELLDQYPELREDLSRRIKQNKQEKISALREQEKIERDMAQFQEKTAGPPIDQLRKSSKNPKRVTDIYGDVPENREDYIDRLPEWARDLLT